MPQTSGTFQMPCYVAFKELPRDKALAIDIEIDKAHDLFAQNSPIPIVEISQGVPKCKCEIYQSLNLPCRHIFYADMYGSVAILNDEVVQNMMK